MARNANLQKDSVLTGAINILTPVLRGQLLAIQRTQSALDDSQLKLATGLEVNSALDNPNNFFTSKSLTNRADDLTRLLDNIGQNLQVIKTADAALEAMSVVLEQSEALVNELLLDVQSHKGSLMDEILADNPDAYWRLNETSGNTAINYGAGGAALNGTYNANIQLGADQLYIGSDADVAADFQGTGNNQRISIADSPLINIGSHDERTVELVFNADDITSRQVLFEEGGQTNALAIYIEGGRIYFNGRDAGAWGPVDISTEIEAGETYHAAFVFDFPNGTFTGYLNGEEVGQEAVNATFPQHTANIGIGGMNGDSYFHDGPQGGSRYTFDGRIADVALYNTALSEADINRHFDASDIQTSIDAEDDLNALLVQLDELRGDALYRGTNLLDERDMETFFNEHRTSSLVTEGVDFSAEGLGLTYDADFNRIEDFNLVLGKIRTAIESVRNYSSSLAADFNILQTRERFISEMIVDLDEGASKLTISDQNEEGARMLALQTRQQIQFSTLSFQANNLTVLDLFS